MSPFSWRSGLACIISCLSLTCGAQNPAFKLEGMTAPRDVEFVAKADGTSQRYVEMLPQSYSPAKTCQLMIFLHGHGSDRWQITKGDQWKEIQAVCDMAARHNMILLSPDYRGRTSWMGPLAEADLVQIIKDQHAARALDRVILAGGSMGGTSVLIFTALHREMVQGVVSLNGTANMLEFAGFPQAVEASYGGGKASQPAEYRKRSPEFVPEKFKALPMAFTAGGQDQIVPSSSVLRLSRALEKQNPGNVLMLYREAGGHSTSYDDAVTALEFVLRRASR